MRLRRYGLLAFLAVLVGPLACATADLGEEDGVTLPNRADAGSAGDAAQPFDAAPEPDTSTPPQDASPPVDAAPSHVPRVFASSTSSNSNFGGLAGGDLKCNSLATAAGLTGKWAAWLSVQNGPHAIDRITSAGPWSLVSGELVASTKAQLVSGALAHAIDHDEKGVLVPAGRVWTGTGTDGHYLTNDCDKWTNGNDGRSGDLTSKTGTWTTAAVEDCGQQRRIYCFEL